MKNFVEMSYDSYNIAFDIKVYDEKLSKDSKIHKYKGCPLEESAEVF